VTEPQQSEEDSVTTPDAESVETVETPETPETPEAVVETVVEAPVETPAETPAEAPVVPATRPVVGGKPVQTVGRRKQAIVRVRLVPGTGKFRLNGRTIEEYFPNKVHQQLIREPLVTVEKPESFDIFATLRGGGITGQAGALRLAIARALIDVEIDDRPALKKAGFLTRDPRAKERKKYGLKKARKAPQYSKR
jgi:small subunit ribosomal protein S9